MTLLEVLEELGFPSMVESIKEGASKSDCIKDLIRLRRENTEEELPQRLIIQVMNTIEEIYKEK